MMEIQSNLEERLARLLEALDDYVANPSVRSTGFASRVLRVYTQEVFADKELANFEAQPLKLNLRLLKNYYFYLLEQEEILKDTHKIQELRYHVSELLFCFKELKTYS